MKYSTIIGATAMYYDRTVEELLSRDRHYPLCEQRQIAMFLCRELAGMSSLSVAEVFSRDHSTVLYAWKKMARARGWLLRDIERLTARLQVAELTA